MPAAVETVPSPPGRQHHIDARRSRNPLQLGLDRRSRHDPAIELMAMPSKNCDCLIAQCIEIHGSQRAAVAVEDRHDVQF
jgi:hypothetical protein